MDQIYGHITQLLKSEFVFVKSASEGWNSNLHSKSTWKGNIKLIIKQNTFG